MSGDPYQAGDMSEPFIDGYYSAKRRSRKLSHRRWTEFRGRYLREMFGDAKTRAARKEYLRLCGMSDELLALDARRVRT